jgi:DNA-binding CsgD family transcriptional regulator
MSSAELLGRKDELSAVERLLAPTPKGSGMLMLEGTAGIGKTTLWLRGLERARRLGFRVLPCRPSPTEAPLAFSALGDVLGELTEEFLSQLPPPQRNALAISLLLRDAEGVVPDQRAVSLATLTLLRTASAETPLLIAIDDVQWLDASSSRVLAFVFRRIEHDRCRVLLARRIEDSAATGVPFDPDFAPRLLETLERVTIGPLSLGAIQSLIRERLGIRLPRPLFMSLYEAAEGNPFFALELARAQMEHGPPLAGTPLRVPESLRELLGKRLAALPRPTQKSLLLAATFSEPTLTLLRKAGGGSLTKAVEIGVVVLDDERIRFTHPLHSSVVYAGASADERRGAHARAAELATNREERARHLALASSGPDESVASELEHAASAAAARAAPDAAAELSELAARMTPPETRDDLRRRRLATAEHLFATGDTRRSRALLESLIAELGPCPERADALVLLSEIVDDLDEAIRLCRQAVTEAKGDDRRLAHSLILLGATYGRIDETESQLAAAENAVGHAERADDTALLIEALQGVANARVLLGGPIDEPLMQRALELERDVGGLPGRQSPRVWYATQHYWIGDYERGKSLIQPEIERALEEGRLAEWLHLLTIEMYSDVHLGNWERVLRLAESAREEASDVGISFVERHLDAAVAMVHALQGDAERARSHLIEIIKEAESAGDRQAATYGVVHYRLLALSQDLPREAVRWSATLGPAEHRDDDLFSEPPHRGFPGADLVEALVALDELSAAEKIVGELDDDAKRTGRPLAVAAFCRARGLLAVARGDAATAREAFEGALAAHTDLAVPFELARTELLYGAALRRGRRRGEAQQQLSRALERFEILGARLWFEKTLRELARARGKRGAETNELTTTERRVAELVAAGSSNKEVAARLFMSVRTVEANLSKVYRKLGVESRSELAGRIGGDDAKSPENG